MAGMEENKNASSTIKSCRIGDLQRYRYINTHTHTQNMTENTVTPVFQKIYFAADFIMANLTQQGARGGVVVKALRYKPTGCGFHSQWPNWNFSVT